MMLCAVYKSKKKVDTYLYVLKEDDFSAVPQPLLKAFGKPEFVMQVPIHKRQHIAQIPRQDFISKMDEQGFYLQLPASSASLLKMHLQEQTEHQSQQ
jgi:uncharacterized protein YcgL (UPF0745 family)